MFHTLLSIAVLALLVGTLHVHAHNDHQLPARGHRCIFDELQKKLIPTEKTYMTRANRRRALEESGGDSQPDDDDEWQPIRILVSTADLDDDTKYCKTVGQEVPDLLGGKLNCTEEDILTDEKKAILVEYLIPEAIKLHAERLKVRPIDELEVPRFSGACGLFTIPEEHHTTGVKDYDYVLYLAAVPTEGNTIAWAGACAITDDVGNPVIGRSNVSPKYIERTDYTVRTVAHEIMHALGFSGFFFTEEGMSDFVSIRDVPSVPVITSNNVVQRMGNHFGCDTVPGMELETAGGPGTAGSHWKLRNAKDELMCGFAGPGRYTAISIAAMEDLGYYKGIYEKAEFMNWGFQAGCGLLTDKCVKEGATQVPTMFCDEQSGPRVCTQMRDGLGECRIVKYDTPLEPPFQYFADPTLGGTSATADYCPLLGNTRGLSCAAGDRDNMSTSVPPSETSRCVDFVDRVESVVAGTCVEVRCNESAATYEVQLAGSTEFVRCPVGTIINAGELSGSTFPPDASIVCPPYREVCPTVFNSLNINVKVESGALGGGDTATKLLGPHVWHVAALVALAAVFAL